ncbi:MAG: methyltransferase domain-containing protein [Gammaproteobacteria bacterium]
MEEKDQIDAVLPDLFGYHLLQVGNHADVDLLSASRIPHCVVMEQGLEVRARSERAVYGESEALPMACDSLDVLVLPHALEFSSAPHQVLREADRTLIPEGHLVLLGFNPWSLWMLWRFAARWRGRVPWCGRFLSLARVKDWLALLGFDIVQTRTYFFRPPFQHAGLMHRLRFLERLGRRLWPILGGGYVLVARKRVATLTPIRPRWRPRRRLVGNGGLVEPYQHRRRPPADRSI